MSELDIQFAGGQTNFAPGDTAAGLVSWKLDSAAAAAELHLLWYTEGRGIRDDALVAVRRFEQPQLIGSEPFSFVLPASPYSCKGQLVSVKWALELVLLPSEETQRVELVMGPQRAVVDLAAAADEAGVVVPDGGRVPLLRQMKMR